MSATKPGVRPTYGRSFHFITPVSYSSNTMSLLDMATEVLRRVSDTLPQSEQMHLRRCVVAVLRHCVDAITSISLLQALPASL